MQPGGGEGRSSAQDGGDPGAAAPYSGGGTACRGDSTACRGDSTACRGDSTACRGDSTACRGDSTACRGDSTGPARRWLSPGHAAALAAVTVLVVSGILIGRSTLAASVAALTSLDWGWILFATGCEVISLVAFGLSRRRLLRADGHRAGFGSVMAVTYASNALSMTIPFAGVQLALVFCYREFRRRGLGSAITGWALAVSAILSTGALALMLVAGAIAGGVSVTTALGLAGAAIFLVPSTAVLLALRYQQIRRTLDRILAKIITGSYRLFRWPGEGAARALENILDRVARIRLPWPRYAEVFALSVLNWAADCGCLAGTIRATGSQVPWHGLLLAYAAGAAVGSAGLTPGGFALVEATLTAALVASGLTAPAALAAVLGYRLISFWMIMIGGWVLMVALTRHRRAHRYQYGGGPAGPRSAAQPTVMIPAARIPGSPAAPG